MSTQTLPVYRLYIHPKDIIELRRDIWNDAPVTGKLTVGKKKMDIDLVFRGSHIREFEKKSYHIAFYNPPIYRQAKEIHLNAEYKDPSIIRNKLSLDFFSDIGCLSPSSRYVFLNVNGKDEGVYLELESVDEHFLKNRNLPEGPIYYAVNGDANFSLMSDIDQKVKAALDYGYERKFGKPADDLFLEELIISINTIPRASFEKEIGKLLNVEQYLIWLAGVVLTQNYDGFVHNYALYRNSETKLFEILPWDYDATWGRDLHGRWMEHDYVPVEGFNSLTARLLDVPAFRKRYKGLLQEFLQKQFTVEYLAPKIETLVSSIRPYLLKDPYKKERTEVFDREPEFIYSFIRERSRFIHDQMSQLD
ncbi:CotH kinase family protein [Mesobacillus zeae]|uniref:Spore coat protein n=1 Tax=Mesobacillus zeae TaxID=1917180 RepID=A0A398BLS5_9BACI|nr:CotH kinase family protein [Mesobacillus zeae]RID88356.1 spore coat protein [Mesobacillus zeae]